MSRPYFQCEAYRNYVKAQTCTWRLLGHMDCEGAIDPQHDPALSSMESDDLDCIPMCRKHHNLHKDKPKYYRSVIDETVLEVTKASMIRGFLRALDLETERPTVKVRNRKAPKVEQDHGTFRKPQKKVKKPTESKYRPIVK